jgi:hypothetical protein
VNDIHEEVSVTEEELDFIWVYELKLLGDILDLFIELADE